ncbi:hypothetical protein [Jeotgalibacillus soli]|uniref:Uncharacterized protein n=1 Tax=Jeotgalibacillus soli TaxID=889306 RepID=A0A0C2V0T1_9BACL|nr:hypothetical protein [Jeotgalibacillus soli]KIL42672.1 hypothetical protein KP78_38950 [Jeotgalibacillus soli]
MDLHLPLQYEEATDYSIQGVVESIKLDDPELPIDYMKQRKNNLIRDLTHNYYILGMSYRLMSPEFFFDHVKRLYNVVTSRGISKKRFFFIMDR